MEQFISIENCSFVWFKEPKQIPNLLKGKAVENRQLVVIAKRIRESLGLHNYVRDQEFVEINTTEEVIEVLITPDKNDKNTWWDIVLEPYTCTRWRIGKGCAQNMEIKLLGKGLTIISVEIFENIDINWSRLPVTNKENLTKVPKALFDDNKSFLRKWMTSKEIKERASFLSVKVGLSMYSHKPLPLAVTITNIHGEDIYSALVTPRGKVKDCRKCMHGVDENLIIDQMDEYENRLKVYKLLEGKIII